MLKQAILCWALCAASVALADTPNKSLEQLEQEFMAFYRQPSGVRGLALLEQASQNDAIASKRSAILNLGRWGGEMLTRYPEQIAKWCPRAGKYAERYQIVAQVALSSTRHPEAQRCLNTLHWQNPLGKTSPNPVAAPITNAADLDALWVAFSVTGNPKAVEKIAAFVLASEKQLLNNPPTNGNSKSQENTGLALTQGAAEWSLRSNIKQNRDVARIVRAYVAKQSVGDKRILQERLGL